MHPWWVCLLHSVTVKSCRLLFYITFVLHYFCFTLRQPPEHPEPRSPIRGFSADGDLLLQASQISPPLGFGLLEASTAVRSTSRSESSSLQVLASRASGTSENYFRAFDRWAEFEKGVLVVPAFPVGPVDCALYLQFLLQSSKSAYAVNCIFYAFKWLHQVARVDSPTLHTIGRFLCEGGSSSS